MFALRTPFLATEEHEVAEAGADPGAERALDLLLGNNSYAFIDIFQFLNVAARVRHNKFWNKLDFAVLISKRAAPDETPSEKARELRE